MGETEDNWLLNFAAPRVVEAYFVYVNFQPHQYPPSNLIVYITGLLATQYTCWYYRLNWELGSKRFSEYSNIWTKHNFKKWKKFESYWNHDALKLLKYSRRLLQFTSPGILPFQFVWYCGSWVKSKFIDKSSLNVQVFFILVFKCILVVAF